MGLRVVDTVGYRGGEGFAKPPLLEGWKDILGVPGLKPSVPPTVAAPTYEINRALIYLQ